MARSSSSMEQLAGFGSWWLRAIQNHCSYNYQYKLNFDFFGNYFWQTV
jgi:hypothetical protein